MSTYIGIDPGKGGGIAIIEYEQVRGTVFSGLSHHTLSLKKSTERDAWDFLKEHVRGVVWPAALERVASSPQMGVVSSFTFGRSYGFLRGILVAMEIPFDEVLPRKWQSEMGCLSGGDKNVTKAKAQQLFPSVKVTHGIADALLLAEYSRRSNMLRRE